MIKTQGYKKDSGKRRWSLMPWDALGRVVDVLMFGMEKYGPRNWEAGMEWSRLYDAALRHLDAWWRRDPSDDESGITHLAHAICCILFLLAYELRRMVQFDDRPKVRKICKAEPRRSRKTGKARSRLRPKG